MNPFLYTPDDLSQGAANAVLFDHRASDDRICPA